MGTTRERRCGVYLIRNRLSGKVYVGQSNDIRRRWRAHLAALRVGQHANDYLQKAWTSDGEAAFEFVVLEDCSEDQLDAREEHFATLFGSLDRAKGYNLETFREGRKVISGETREKQAARKRGQPMHPKTQAAFPGCHKGRKRSEAFKENLRQKNLGKKATPETRRKLSESHKGYVPTEEHRAKLSAAGKGRVLSAEHRAKISATMRKRAQQANQASAEASQVS